MFIDREYYVSAFNAKARRYKIAECRAAIADIDKTLDIWADRPMTDVYVQRLWIERDAMLDRIHALSRKGVTA